MGYRQIQNSFNSSETRYHKQKIPYLFDDINHAGFRDGSIFRLQRAKDREMIGILLDRCLFGMTDTSKKDRYKNGPQRNRPIFWFIKYINFFCTKAYLRNNTNKIKNLNKLYFIPIKYLECFIVIVIVKYTIIKFYKLYYYIKAKKNSVSNQCPLKAKRCFLSSTCTLGRLGKYPISLIH